MGGWGEGNVSEVEQTGKQGKREAAEEIKLEKGSGWDWLDVAVWCEITKPSFDGGLNVPCLLRLPVSPSWTHTLRKLFPGVKWINCGTALGILQGRKMKLQFDEDFSADRLALPLPGLCGPAMKLL